jgi:hypothetical protein
MGILSRQGPGELHMSGSTLQVDFVLLLDEAKVLLQFGLD